MTDGAVASAAQRRRLRRLRCHWRHELLDVFSMRLNMTGHSPLDVSMDASKCDVVQSVDVPVLVTGKAQVWPLWARFDVLISCWRESPEVRKGIPLLHVWDRL